MSSFDEIRYVENGEEIVIHFHHEPTDGKYGNHSAWLDGGSTGIDVQSMCQSQTLPVDLPSDHKEVTKKQLKKALNYLAQNEYYFCKYCGNPYPQSQKVSTGFAGQKCSACDSDHENCPESGGEHDYEIISGRNNARVDTVMKCIHCGKRKKTPATG